ncbi:hypothetical protein LBMAG52_00300 [Planctomycetia bacterium]|nr:hypothetical protein LBMAG52_00300 [Planctomycetia bacterium]
MGQLPEVFFVPSKFVAERMKTVIDDSRPYFWMKADEASEFQGEKGLNQLRGILVPGGNDGGQ